MMRRIFNRERFSRKLQDPKDSDDTISINSQWLLEEEETDYVDGTKDKNKKKKSKKKHKKDGASKYWNRKYLKAHGKGIPGSKTLFSILKGSTWDLRELTDKFLQNDQTAYFSKLRKQALKYLEEDDVDGLVGLVEGGAVEESEVVVANGGKGSEVVAAKGGHGEHSGKREDGGSGRKREDGVSGGKREDGGSGRKREDGVSGGKREDGGISGNGKDDSKGEKDEDKKDKISLEDEELSDPRNHMTLLHTALEEGMRKVGAYLVSNGAWEYVTRGFSNIACQIPPSKKTSLHIVVEQGDLKMFQLILGRLKSLNPHIPEVFQAILSPAFDDMHIDKVTHFLHSRVVIKEGNDKRRVGLGHLAALNGHQDLLPILQDEGISMDACDNWKETPLMWAVKKGRLEAFNVLLRLGVDANKRNQYGSSALHLAVSSSQQEMAAILIDLPSTDLNKERIKNPRCVVEMVAKHNDHHLMQKLMSPDVRDRIERKNLKNALFIASIEGHTSIINHILEQIPGLTNMQDDLGNTPVMVAAEHLKLDAVKSLVEKHTADISIKNHLLETIFDLAMRQSTNDLLEYLMDHTKSDELLKPMYLHTAAANGDNGKIEFILKTGKMLPLQLDNNGNTIFHTSAANDAFQVLEYFLAKDDDLTELQNKEGETPLHVAVKKGNLKSVEVLLERNAGTNIGDSFNQNALHCSISSPHSSYEVVELVVAKMKERCPDDLNAQDFDGNTALHLAAKSMRGELIGLLVELDPNVEDINGETALHVAVRVGGKQEVDSILKLFYVGEKNEERNIDKKDVNGCTALYKSAEIGERGKFDALMTYGADVTLGNNDGCSILHRIVEKSVQNSAESEKYVCIYECIVRWSVKGFCRREGYQLPLENTSHFYEVQLQAVRYLTSHLYYKNCNVLQYASKKGASGILKAILNTPNVYKFGANCPIRNSKKCKKFNSSPSPSSLVLSQYISSINKNHDQALYDVTYLIPKTKPINETQVQIEVNDLGVSKAISNARINKISCLEHIVDTNDEEFINDILDREPFKLMVSEYWKLCRRVYEVLMWIHVCFMITFTYFTLPSKQFLKHRFNHLSDHTDPDLLYKRHDFVKDLGWLLIWPVFILFSKAIMATHYLMTLKDIDIGWQEMTLGKSKLSEITSGLMKLPVGLMLFVFNHLSTISALIFAFSSLAWFVMAVFANNPHDYLQSLAIVMIFGWMHTIAYVKGFKDWNALANILKQVIIKDITCFIYIYIFVMVSFGYAMHVLMQADYHLDQDQRRSTTTIYLTFMRTISPGNLMDISESKDYEAAGGRVYFMRAVCACYAIFGTVVLMNLLIAMMNSTYSAIRSDKSTAWRIDSLSFALWVERNFACVCWKFVLKLAVSYDAEENRWYILQDTTEGAYDGQDNLINKEDRREAEMAAKAEKHKDSKIQKEAVLNISERLEKLEKEIVGYRKEMQPGMGDERGVMMMMTEMKMEMRRIHELCLETSAITKASRRQLH